MAKLARPRNSGPDARRRLRVALVSHSCIAALNRAKVEALAARSGLDVLLVAPTNWREPLFGLVPLRIDEPHSYETLPIRIHQPGRVFAAWYDLDVIEALRAFRPDVLHVEEEPAGLAALEFALVREALRIPVLVGFTYDNLGTALSLPKRLIERFFYRRASALVVGNSAAGAIARTRGFRGPMLRAPVAGVDPGEYAPQPDRGWRETLGVSEASFVITFVGRLEPEKGILTLLDAVAGLGSSCTLLLVGRGSQRQELLRRAEVLQISDRLKHYDSVPHSDVPNYLRASDVVVLPSVVGHGWMEQFGHILIEAMACRTAVVGSSSGAIPEVLAGGGLIYPEGDAEALREVLRSLRDDRQLRNQVAEAGYRRVLRHYTNEAIAEQLHQLYEAAMMATRKESGAA